MVVRALSVKESSLAIIRPSFFRAQAVSFACHRLIVSRELYVSVTSLECERNITCLGRLSNYMWT